MAGRTVDHEQWIGRLLELVGRVDAWGQELGWSTRQINRRLEDPEGVLYDAPALVLQKDTTRLLLEPVGRDAPGAEGVVDLYLMPGLDDIASLYFYDGGWHIHYAAPGGGPGGGRKADARPLSRDSLGAVVEGMVGHAA